MENSVAALRQLAFIYNGDISYGTFIAVSCIAEMQLKSMSIAEAFLSQNNSSLGHGKHLPE